MLSLNISMTALFTQINTWFNALWAVAVITIGIPFALGLVTYISNEVRKGVKSH